MTCREALNLLPLLLDGELESRQMRGLVMHSTRCAPCETELRQLERLQEVLSESVNARVDELDLSNFWPRIDQQLGTLELSWWQRLRAWWDEGEHRWMVQLPALGTAAVIAVLAMVFFLRSHTPTIDPGASQVADLMTIDSLESDRDVAMINDPETPLLWVSEDSVLGDTP